MFDERCFCENCDEEYCPADTGCELCYGCLNDLCGHSKTITRACMDSEDDVGYEVVCKICGMVLRGD